MSSAPPSAPPMAILVAATRTVATARVALSSQASAAPLKQYSRQTPDAEGAPAPTEASEADSVKPN